ncbi:MAG: hypothetical protein IJ184_06760 [Alphaproteobacteria bacterium]|nr:hypothetical protein [Alphaproteobacteria bacterium]
MPDNNKIKIMKLDADCPVLGLNEGDYYAVHNMDFYAGAGVYGIDTGANIKLAKCIEMLDGKIQISDMCSANAQVMTPQDFRKVVRVKLFAKIALEGNISTIAEAELDELLMSRR